LARLFIDENFLPLAFAKGFLFSRPSIYRPIFTGQPTGLHFDSQKAISYSVEGIRLIS